MGALISKSIAATRCQCMGGAPSLDCILRRRSHLDAQIDAMGNCSKGEADPPKTPANQVQITEKDRAVLELKGARDKVKKYKRKLDSKIEQDRARAKELTKGLAELPESVRARKKKQALVFLKKIKLQEAKYTKADDQMSNLETMIADYEFAKVEVQIFEGIKAGNQAIQAMQKELSVEDAEKVMDEAAEGLAYCDEIGSILSEQLSDYDNEQVLEDLARMEEEWGGVAPAMPDAPVTQPDMPDVPISQPAMPDAPVSQEAAAAEDPQPMLA